MIQKLNNKNYQEVYEILKKLGESYINRLPKKLYVLIEERASAEPKIDKKEAISREAIAFIAMLHYHYWCDTEEEKQELMDVFNENEEKRKQEAYEKYNPDVFAQNRTEMAQEKENKNTELVVKKEEKWYKKIVNFIKSIFKRRNF